MKKNKDYEIEVKFRIADPFAFRNRILALGGQSGGRFFEKNILFDTGGENLREKNILLRLRKSRTSLLTVKSPSGDPDPEFKILKELETGIEDFETTRKIFHLLGFSKETPYEKFREDFLLRNITLSLDELPFGYFAELEGEKEEIRHLASALGLDWAKRKTENYLELFRIFTEKDPENSPEELTFEAFRKQIPE